MPKRTIEELFASDAAACLQHTRRPGCTIAEYQARLPPCMHLVTEAEKTRWYRQELIWARDTIAARDSEVARLQSRVTVLENALAAGP